MSNVWFCSDLHFGHKNIEKFRSVLPLCGAVVDNERRIMADWQSVVTKRDIVYVLGDAAFSMESVELFRQLPGKKFLVRGNHDCLNTSVYLKYFDEVYGLLKYKEFWLSHAPIHPDELRGKVNLHGHVHYKNIQHAWDEYGPLALDDPNPDFNYFNMCPENLWPLKGRALISLDEIRKHLAFVNRQ